MPRKVAQQPVQQPETDEQGQQKVCYLDNFLESVTETVDLPANIKRGLAHLRDLDTQAQEQYERMQKQSKNHVARAKRSVQGGHEPDEELLHKARRSCRELMEIDQEKVACADQLYDDLSRHLERCEGELCKFEEELRERGQLKTPVSVKSSEPAGASSADGAAGGLNVQVGGGAGDMAAPPVSAGGRRGRQAPTGDVAASSPTSHKRGRGRKVSHKEAERQRLAAESAAAAAASQSARAEQMLAPHGCGFGMGGMMSPGGGDFGGSFGAAPPRQEYPDATLPVAAREDSNRPLCGAVPPAPTYVIPERHKVAAQISKEDWILASVLKFNTVNNKYIILDADEGDDGGETKQHQVPMKFVLPLPLFEPSVYTAHNELCRGQMVLALYPDTTCFYKALVHTPPSLRRQRDYLVEFEDESEPTGRSEAQNVPQKYVLRIPDYAR